MDIYGVFFSALADWSIYNPCWLSLAAQTRSLFNHSSCVYGGCLKWWYPTTMGFPTKNYLFWVFWGYRHLRKHSYISGKILTTSSDLNQKGALVLEVNPSGQERHINCRKCRRRNLETDLYRYRDTVTYYHIEYINMDLWSFVPCFRSLIVYETVMGRITLHVYFFSSASFHVSFIASHWSQFCYINHDSIFPGEHGHYELFIIS